jgi:sulfide:quinone oxidoreductase
MAKVVVLGGGVAGHTAATYLKKGLGSKHEVVVVTPNSKWNWIPSNIWVGVGKMSADEVTFELGPVYNKIGINYKQAKAVSINPEGDANYSRPYVTVEYTSVNRAGEIEKVDYDYLINATGPKLNFGATPGIGPDGFTESVCTANHAAEASRKLDLLIKDMQDGEEKKIVIGTGHGMCTCQGAAFEYIFNVEHKLKEAGVRDKAKLTWLSNEYELGDFGMGGMHIKRGGYVTHSKVFTESIMAERDVEWVLRSHVTKVEDGKIHTVNLDGETDEIEFDFSMLIPPFAGVGLKAYDKDGEDITSVLFAPNGFLKVDADYTPKPYEEWKAKDWPETYQNPTYKNIFAAGIAFAPPHLISKPMSNPDGVPINPTPPRTGMPSGMIGAAVASSIKDMILDGASDPTHKKSMADMGAACVASTGMGFFNGSAASMTVYPVVPDYERYPQTGRDENLTFGEVGLAGHWIKHFLHYTFMYKAKLKPLWWLLPE